MAYDPFEEHMEIIWLPQSGERYVKELGGLLVRPNDVFHVTQEIGDRLISQGLAARYDQKDHEEPAGFEISADDIERSASEE